jgi:hypothetical protein
MNGKIVLVKAAFELPMIPQPMLPYQGSWYLGCLIVEGRTVLEQPIIGHCHFNFRKAA